MKKYYKLEEKVYIKTLHTTGIVKGLEPQNLIAFVELPEGKIVDVKFFDMDKFHPKDEILFAKVKPNAKIPSKRFEDGCYDIYACFEEDYIEIKPGEIKLIPTGIASSFSPKYRINCKRERGSTGKIGMTTVSGQIDSGYRGEWFIAINNTTNKDIIIFKILTGKDIGDCIMYPYGKAICQAALEFVPNVNIKEISYEELKQIPSERGMSKLGDSGK